MIDTTVLRCPACPLVYGGQFHGDSCDDCPWAKSSAPTAEQRDAKSDKGLRAKAKPGAWGVYVIQGGPDYTATLQLGQVGDRYGKQNRDATREDADFIEAASVGWDYWIDEAERQRMRAEAAQQRANTAEAEIDRIHDCFYVIEEVCRHIARDAMEADKVHCELADIRLAIARVWPKYKRPGYAVAFRDPRGRVLFVCDGLSGGREWGTFWRNANGSLHRFRGLPMREDRKQAETDLEDYANRRGLDRVDLV